MFDKEFYPTPKALIRKLLEPYKVKSTVATYYKIEGEVLDPSAGKGDILDYIDELKGRYNNKINYSCIEKSIELQDFLRSKDYSLVHNDFLTYDEDFYYDYIVMNPPFSNGDEHLLKAIEIGNGTHIACILNAETIRNPYSKKRKKLVDLIEEHNGKIEFVQGAFEEAERQTGVEVALVWLYVEKTGDFEFDFFAEKEVNVNFDFDVENDGIARQDLVGNLEIRYNEVQKAYRAKLVADAKFNHYLKEFTDGEGFTSKDLTLKGGEQPSRKYTILGRKLKKMMWGKVIKKLDLKRFMSSKVIQNFDAFISQQSKMAFNKENVSNFFQLIMDNRVSILEQSIVEVFDELTSHGYRKDNRMYVEQWKTNNAYKVNRKFIAPTYVKYGDYCSAEDLRNYGSCFSFSYHGGRDRITDLDKVMCYIVGRRFIGDYDRRNDDKGEHKNNDFLSVQDALERHFKELGKVRTGDKFENKTESTFFEIKFFKKGTIHLKWKDERLWKEFNLRACSDKNWLPNDEYTEWQEEKAKPNYKLLN